MGCGHAVLGCVPTLHGGQAGSKLNLPGQRATMLQEKAGTLTLLSPMPVAYFGFWPHLPCRQSRDGPRFWFHAGCSVSCIQVSLLQQRFRCLAKTSYVSFLPGSLCFVATVLACTCGLWTSKKTCALYWAYEVGNFV